jgi:hypothetical protein
VAVHVAEIDPPLPAAVLTPVDCVFATASAWHCLLLAHSLPECVVELEGQFVEFVNHLVEGRPVLTANPDDLLVSVPIIHMLVVSIRVTFTAILVVIVIAKELARLAIR